MKHLLSLFLLFLLVGCSQQTPRTSGIEGDVSGEVDETVPVTVEEEVPTIETPAAPASAKNVTLVLGDSHMVGAYGDALMEHIKTRSDLLMIANCGAGSYTFLTTPIKRPCRGGKYKTVVVRREPETFAPQLVDPMASLASTAKELDPDVVVIGLGTNYDNISSESIRKLTEILAQNAPSMTKLVWLGPPYFLKKEGDSIPVVTSIRKTFGLSDSHHGQYQTSVRTIDVVFADSTPFNKERHPLNIPKGNFHFYGKRTREWADFTWELIRAEFEPQSIEDHQDDRIVGCPGLSDSLCPPNFTADAPGLDAPSLPESAEHARAPLSDVPP